MRKSTGWYGNLAPYMPLTLLMAKQINADNALRDELMKNNKSTVRFDWPDPVEQSALCLWNSFKTNWKWKNKSKAANSWIDTLDNMFDFTCFLHGKIVLVSQMKIVGMEQDKKKQIKITGAYCPGTFNTSGNPWNPDQILRCPEDGSFGLIDFGNGDYAGIGRLDISNVTVASIFKAETKIILKGSTAKRCGPAGGHMLPPQDENGPFPASMSKITRHNNLLTTTEGSFSTVHRLAYVKPEANKATLFNSVYPDIHMSRLTKAKKKDMAFACKHTRQKLIAEMKSRFLFLLIVVECGLGDATKLFSSFAEACGRHIGDSQQWKKRDVALSEFDCLLLEYACGTGEMRNHQPLSAHKDSNKSHPVESMTVFGKVAVDDVQTSGTLVQNMKNALLIQPFEGLVWEMRCGRDVLHSCFMNTWHLPDLSRGSWNWSSVHGP
jgi:hypothetical protein